MMSLPLIGRLSTRMHLAFGLAGLTVGVLLAATYIGLVPDAEALERQHRGALSEAIAVTASSLLDEAQPEALQETLAFLRKRNPELQSIGVRAHDGSLLVDINGHAAHWAPGAREHSTDAEIMVPVWQAGELWGKVELRFTPLRDAGWRGHLQDPSLKLSGFVFVVCALLFLGYLKRMLRELDPSRVVPKRVQQAYDTLTEGMLVLDTKGAIVMANKAIVKVLLGTDDPKRLLSRSADAFPWASLDRQPVARTELPWVRSLTSRLPLRDQFLTVEDTEGTPYSFRANCSPLQDAPGAPMHGLVVSFQDITQLEKSRSELRAAKEQADAASQAKSQFLANMSHEIRTPMNAILGFTEVLRRTGLRQSHDAAKHLDIIHSSGKHLLNLINDILDLSKVEAGRLEAEKLPFAPHQVAREVVQTLAERAQDKGLTLDVVHAQALPAQIDGDPARLRQILTNLIGNAIKFTERGSVKVVMRLEQTGARTRYCIDVQDSGIGIAADKVDSVFEPFVQAEASTTRRFGGTGLGLTISRGFARAMGGDITARSVLGQGTTFSVWLDAGDLAAAEMLSPLQLAADDVAAPTLQAVRWRFPARRVLVVDDGTENRQLVRVLLEEVGLQVEEAENGRVAVDRVSAEAFDLVLMDMQMPVMDGQTATRTLRDRGCTLPIVALTANAMKGFEAELDAAGFSGFLTKPIDVDALMHDLAARLGGTSIEADAEPDGVDLSIEPADIASEAAAEDEAPLVSRLAGHAKLGRIVARFVEQLPDKLTQMDEAAARADMAELAALAHGLKGAGGSMGFDVLFEPAKALEDAAKAGDAAGVEATMRILHRLESRILRGAAAPRAELEGASA